MASKTLALLALALCMASIDAYAQEAAPAPAPVIDPAAPASDAVESPAEAAAISPVAPAAALPPPAPTQPWPLNNPGGGTLGDLDRIQSEIVMAEARAKLADARINLSRAEGTGVDLDIVTSGPPVVAGVFGTSEAPYARFLLPDGSQMIGRVGDQLGGGYRVSRISVDQVVIKDKKGQQIVARFNGTSPAKNANAGAGAANPNPAGIVRSPMDR